MASALSRSVTAMRTGPSVVVSGSRGGVRTAAWDSTVIIGRLRGGIPLSLPDYIGSAGAAATPSAFAPIEASVRGIAPSACGAMSF